MGEMLEALGLIAARARASNCDAWHSKASSGTLGHHGQHGAYWSEFTTRGRDWP